MRYRINDTIHEASSAKELVTQLNQSSFSPADTDVEWMKQTAGRITVASGEEVRHNTAENFVADLIKIKFITEVLK